MKGVFLANQKVDGKVVTLITYSKGRDWDYLRPPSTDMNGKPTNCKPVSALLTAYTFPGVGTRRYLRTQGSEMLMSEKGHLGDMNHLFLWAWWRGPHGTPCFTEELTGSQREECISQLLPQQCCVTSRPKQQSLFSRSVRGWARSCTWGLVDLGRDLVSSFWDPPMHIVRQQQGCKRVSRNIARTLQACLCIC